MNVVDVMEMEFLMENVTVMVMYWIVKTSAVVML